MPKQLCMACGRNYETDGGHSCRCNPVKKDREAMRDRDVPMDHGKSYEERLRDGFNILSSCTQE